MLENVETKKKLHVVLLAQCVDYHTRPIPTLLVSMSMQLQSNFQVSITKTMARLKSRCIMHFISKFVRYYIPTGYEDAASFLEA